MKFLVEIRCDNAAFEDSSSARDAEVARILRKLADRLALGDSPVPLFDVNGNRVGEAGYSDV